jgi:ubiquinone/menaquinone biosynthesis C-methylase UbiE
MAMIWNHLYSTYNRYADKYDSYTRWTGFRRVPKSIVTGIAKVSPQSLRPGVSVLDFGCGTGHLSQLFFKKQAHLNIVGLEPAYAMRAICRQKMKDQKNFTLVNGAFDGRGLPFLNDSFDIVASSGVFDHLPMNTNVTTEFMRIVKPGGLLAFSYPKASYGFLPEYMSERYLMHPSDRVHDCLERAGAEVLTLKRAASFFELTYVSVSGLAIARKPF